MKALRIGFILSAVLAATAWVAWPQAAANDPLDSLIACKDTQKLLFENPFVRVIDDQIPPGATEPLHRHPHGVVVYLNTYTNEQTTENGAKKLQNRVAGTAQWSDATVHTVKNIGSTPSHAIRIELKF
jgi:aspartyl/asparaginyl beta-hydroxylase (cupin superfamily)